MRGSATWSPESGRARSKVSFRTNVATAAAAPMTKAQRANQRNAVLAGFLGWTLDAFDFFILTLVVDDIAKSQPPSWI